MIHVRKFVERVSAQEGRAGRDVLLPIAEARALRDEIVNLLADRVELLERAPVITEVQVKGGTWNSK